MSFDVHSGHHGALCWLCELYARGKLRIEDCLLSSDLLIVRVSAAGSGVKLSCFTIHQTLPRGDSGGT